MKISELVDIVEHQLIAHMTFNVPKIDSRWEKVDERFATSYGQVEVWKLRVENEAYYAFAENQEIVSYIGIEYLTDDLAFARNAHSIKPGKGLAKSLFLYLASYEGLTLLSDSTMSIDGENLWLNLMASNLFICGIFSRKTHKFYNLDDDGKTIDGEKVYDPRRVIAIEPNFYWFIRLPDNKKRAKDSMLQETRMFLGT